MAIVWFSLGKAGTEQQNLVINNSATMDRSQIM